MKLDLVAKNYSVSQNLEEVLQKKLAKLDKYFEDQTQARVVMKGEANHVVLEVTINYHGIVLRSEVRADHVYDCIDIALPKLEKQLIKYKEKFSKWHQKQAIPMPKEEEKEEGTLLEIAKTKSFVMDRVDLKEAVAGLELVGHDFYVFINSATDNVEVVYKRNDGTIGHIIPTVE